MDSTEPQQRQEGDQFLSPLAAYAIAHSGVDLAMAESRATARRQSLLDALLDLAAMYSGQSPAQIVIDWQKGLAAEQAAEQDDLESASARPAMATQSGRKGKGARPIKAATDASPASPGHAEQTDDAAVAPPPNGASAAPWASWCSALPRPDAQRGDDAARRNGVGGTDLDEEPAVVAAGDDTVGDKPLDEPIVTGEPSLKPPVADGTAVIPAPPLNSAPPPNCFDQRLDPGGGSGDDTTAAAGFKNNVNSEGTFVCGNENGAILPKALVDNVVIESMPNGRGGTSEPETVGAPLIDEQAAGDADNPAGEPGGGGGAPPNGHAGEQDAKPPKTAEPAERRIRINLYHGVNPKPAMVEDFTWSDTVAYLKEARLTSEIKEKCPGLSFARFEENYRDNKVQENEKPNVISVSAISMDFDQKETIDQRTTFRPVPPHIIARKAYPFTSAEISIL